MMQDYTGYNELLDRSGLDKSVFVHPTAVVARGAELGSGVRVGPNVMIGPKVVLGDNVKIGAGAVLDGRTKIGEGTQIFPFASVGSAPQDLKYKGEDAELTIGRENRIREYVNISIGTEGGGGKTVIGDHNLVMVYTHIGHDCIIGNHCIFANGVQLAGHVIVGNYVVFGGLAGAHQFSRYGDLAMIAAGAMVSQDVPPFCMVHGNHARIAGLNVVGLRRAGSKNLSVIKTMYRHVFSDNLTLADAIAKITADVESCPEREAFIKFLNASERGICR